MSGLIAQMPPTTKTLASKYLTLRLALTDLMNSLPMIAPEHRALRAIRTDLYKYCNHLIEFDTEDLPKHDEAKRNLALANIVQMAKKKNDVPFELTPPTGYAGNDEDSSTDVLTLEPPIEKVLEPKDDSGIFSREEMID